MSAFTTYGLPSRQQALQSASREYELQSTVASKLGSSTLLETPNARVPHLLTLDGPSDCVAITSYYQPSRAYQVLLARFRHAEQGRFCTRAFTNFIDVIVRQAGEFFSCPFAARLRKSALSGARRQLVKAEIYRSGAATFSEWSDDVSVPSTPGIHGYVSGAPSHCYWKRGLRPG